VTKIKGLCGHAIDLPALLDATAGNAAGSSAMLYARCGVCGEGTEMRLANGGVTVGYSYFGGSLHFEPMERYPVKGLKVTASDPDDLEVVLGGRRWRFAVDTPSRHRFVVFDNAFAVGRALAALEFERLSVVVEAVERGAERIAPDPELVVRAGDFLHLRGPAPALTRAWHHMNDGGGRGAA